MRQPPHKNSFASCTEPQLFDCVSKHSKVTSNSKLAFVLLCWRNRDVGYSCEEMCRNQLFFWKKIEKALAELLQFRGPCCLLCVSRCWPKTITTQHRPTKLLDSRPIKDKSGSKRHIGSGKADQTTANQSILVYEEWLIGNPDSLGCGAHWRGDRLCDHVPYLLPTEYLC